MGEPGSMIERACFCEAMVRDGTMVYDYLTSEHKHTRSIRVHRIVLNKPASHADFSYENHGLK